MATAEFSKDPEDIILICDGVRPMLSEELITNCIKDTKKYKTAVPVTPSIDSLLYSEDGETCGKSYQRSTMYITQAPQGYTMERILWAHEELTREVLQTLFPQVNFLLSSAKRFIFSLARDSTLR